MESMRLTADKQSVDFIRFFATEGHRRNTEITDRIRHLFLCFFRVLLWLNSLFSVFSVSPW